MTTIDSLRDRHTEIMDMIKDLRAIMTKEHLSIRPNAKTAYELLCDLADKLKEHLSEEDKGLYPPLLIHEDPKIKSIAWGFISGEKPLRKMFDAYYKKWLKDCDFNFTEEFLTDSEEIFSLIQDRIDREERVLFPRLEKTGMFKSASV